MEGKVDGDGDEGEFENGRAEQLTAVARNVVEHGFQPARLLVSGEFGGNRHFQAFHLAKINKIVCYQNI